MHSLFCESIPPEGDLLVIEGEEARHAVKVKRVGPGEPVRLLDGRGTLGRARVADTKGRLVLEVVERVRVGPVTPSVHVLSATPKGPRVGELVESLVQVGAASWSPMQTKLGVVDPRESKIARQERVVLEACKQAQRPWLLELGAKTSFAQALKVDVGMALVLADALGGAYVPSGGGEIRVLIGPEGGFMPEEIASARAAGAQVACFGPHIMRIETAAPTAVAVILDRERGEAGRPAR